MGLVRNGVDLLHGEGDSDKGRAKPAGAHRGDGAVVVALAVAEARAAPVEADDRHDDEVGMRRRGAASTGTIVPKPPGMSGWPGAKPRKSSVWPGTITGRPITAPLR